MVLSPHRYFTRVMSGVTQPSFIVAGGVRCATGWIRECLSEHPEIYMQPKETHYFDQNYDKGYEWYNGFFQDKTLETIIGEKTASYLHDEQVAIRIKETLPEVKLIFCLRDPVDRMYSHYTMSASSDNDLRHIGFLKGVEFDSKFMEMGLYCRQLAPFFSKFPRENILIKIYEDIQSDPFAFISEMYDFVGASPEFKAPSTQLRTKLGQLEHNSWFWGNISKVMLHPRAPFFFRTYYTRMRPNEDDEILSNDIYKRFVDFYRDDMLELETLLDKDLNIWRTRRFVVE